MPKILIIGIGFCWNCVLFWVIERVLLLVQTCMLACWKENIGVDCGVFVCYWTVSLAIGKKIPALISDAELSMFNARMITKFLTRWQVESVLQDKPLDHNSLVN